MACPSIIHYTEEKILHPRIEPFLMIIILWNDLLIMNAKLKYLKEKISRYGLMLTVVNILTNKASKFIPDVLMNPIYEYKHKLVKKNLMPFVTSIIADKKEKDNANENSTQKKISFEKEPIWVCWLQGNEKMPELVKTCYRSVLKFAGKHPVVLVTLDNLGKYVDIDERIIKKFKIGIIKAAAFSDIIRFNLLYIYGGLWLDATIYCTSIIDDRFFKTDFQSIGNNTTNKRFVANGRWCAFLIGSQSLSNSIYYLKTMYETYLIREDCMIDYLLIDYLIDLLYSKRPDFRNTLASSTIIQPDVMTLQSILNKRYDPKVWKKITHDTQFFKLNWRDYSDSELYNFCNDSFYAHIRNIVDT